MFPLMKIVRNTCEEIQGSTFSILFHPIQEQLVTVNSVEMLDSVWMSSSAGSDSREPDMPDFSFSPQEYITQIGQYLMTLPQHLEPYMTHDNPALSRALKVTFCISRKTCHSNHLGLIGTSVSILRHQWHCPFKRIRS